MADLIQAAPAELTGAAPTIQSKSSSSSESLTALQPLTQQVVGDMGGLSEMGGLGGTLETFHWRFQLSGECLAGALTDFSNGLMAAAQSFTGHDQQWSQLFQQLKQQMPTPIYPGFEAPSGSVSGAIPPEDPNIPEEPELPEVPDMPEIPDFPEIPDPVLVP